ncbi:MAG TPA: hypothetical protein VF874_08635 [Mycobacterium sp.]
MLGAYVRQLGLQLRHGGGCLLGQLLHRTDHRGIVENLGGGRVDLAAGGVGRRGVPAG